MLAQASRSIDLELTARLEPLAITPRGFCVLDKALPGDLSQGQIAAAADLDKTTMVATVDQLEAAGLAERRPSPSDRRARIIVVTKAGERMVARAQRVVDGVFEDVLGGLPGRDRGAFLGGLERIVERHPAEPAGASPRRRGGNAT